MKGLMSIIQMWFYRYFHEFGLDPLHYPKEEAKKSPAFCYMMFRKILIKATFLSSKLSIRCDVAHQNCWLLC